MAVTWKKIAYYDTLLTVEEQEIVGRLTGGNVDGITIGIADNNMVQIDDADAADDDYCKLTANGIEGRSYAEVLADLSGQAGAAFNCNTQEFQNLVCHKGSTMPAAPTDGQWFLFNGTGRTILYQYNSEWIPIISVGTMTLYVDKTDGTDDLNHGTAVDASAFATVQYAVDCIPGLVGGNVVIYINAEDYAETVTIRGKKASGNYTITLQGTLTESSSGTQSANGVLGVDVTQGSFTDTGNLAGVANLLCYLAADGDYRIIDSSTANTATICGTFTSQPLQTEAYVIYDWGTSINSLVVNGNQQGIKVYDISFDTLYPITREDDAVVDFYRCKLASSGSINCIFRAGSSFLYYCYVESDGQAVYVERGEVKIYSSKIYTSTTNDRCVRTTINSLVWIRAGTVLDAASTTTTYGIYAETGAQVGCYSTAAEGYPRIRNQAVGIRAQSGAQVAITANIQYSGNTLDESADAASFGYID